MRKFSPWPSCIIVNSQHSRHPFPPHVCLEAVVHAHNTGKSSHNRIVNGLIVLLHPPNNAVVAQTCLIFPVSALSRRPALHGVCIANPATQVVKLLGHHIELHSTCTQTVHPNGVSICVLPMSTRSASKTSSRRPPNVIKPSVSPAIQGTAKGLREAPPGT